MTNQEIEDLIRTLLDQYSVDSVYKPWRATGGVRSPLRSFDTSEQRLQGW